MRYLVCFLIAQFMLVSPVLAQSFEQEIDQAKTNMMVDPVQALERAEAAEQMADTTSEVQIATALWLQGEALKRMNRLEDAKMVIQSARAQLGDAQTETKLFADLLVAEAGIAAVQSDYAIALENYQQAHDVFLALGENRAQAMALFHVADIHADARSFTKALSFYARAQEAYSEDPQIELARLNNVATAHREFGDYEAALIGLDEALAIAVEIDSPMLQARILTNKAAVELDAGAVSSARTTLDKAQKLETESPSGWQGPITGMYAKIAFAEGNVQGAGQQISDVFAGFDLTTTPAPFLEFHEAAYQIYDQLGNSEAALLHLTAFKRLDDEKRNVAANANTALLSAEFDFATQELQIANLRTETLEAEVRLRETRARQRLVIFVGLAIVLLAALIAGLFHYRKMRMNRDEVRDANTKLNTSNQALEKALKAKSEFLATTSHEIHTPLNAILGMSQLMSTRKDLDAETQERAELVHSSGLTMKAIVDDILDMSKIESGTMAVHEAPCELAGTLASVSNVWRARADENGLTLQSDFEACPAAAITDERKLRQIVLNLMSNAVKFTDSGEVQIRATLDATASEPTLCVTITDTGCGIPSDKFEEIFEPFTQVDSSTTRPYSGTGLGLSIARNFAYAMGGDITVESELEKGSTFTLRLPLKGVVEQTEDAEHSPANVLLIEPNFIRQGILEGLLEARELSYLMLDEMAEIETLASPQTFDTIFISKDVYEGQPAAFLDFVQLLTDRFEMAAVILEKAPECTLEDGLLRLSGVSEIVEPECPALTLILKLASATEQNQTSDSPLDSLKAVAN